MLDLVLQDLEDRINPDEEDKLLQDWVDFSEGRCLEPVFDPHRSQPSPPKVSWPEVTINAALEDYDLMALQQFGACSNLLSKASGLLMNVRCNYGTAILPSLFGVDLFVMDESLNTLPTNWPLADPDKIQRLLDAGPPDIHTGYGRQVFEMGARYAEILSHYPKISRYVTVYHPDLQGPMDVCELLWGSSIFYALYDQADLVHGLLALVSETYIRMMDAWLELFPAKPHGGPHWGFYHQGSLMLRDDSAMNLSKKMVQAFILPYDQGLLDHFHGGAVHFCGKGDHFIEPLAGLDGLFAVNLSQPELNEMELVFQNTVDQGINLLGLPRWAAETALGSGRELHGRVHVVT